MRSKDRLFELQRAAGALQSEVLLEPPPADPDVEAMFQEVDRMRGWIHELNANTQLMRRLHADPTFHTNRRLQDQLDSLVTQSHAVATKVCGALREFEPRAHAPLVGARARMARLQYACTRHLYADALDAHHAALAALRDNRLDLLHEQIKLTNLTISDEECQTLLDTKNISLFVDNFPQVLTWSCRCPAEGGDGGGAARAAGGGGAPRGARAARGLHPRRAGPLHAAGAARLYTAREDRDGGAHRTAGLRARGAGRPRPAPGEGLAPPRQPEKNWVNNLPRVGLRASIIGTDRNVVEARDGGGPAVGREGTRRARGRPACSDTLLLGPCGLKIKNLLGRMTTLGRTSH